MATAKPRSHDEYTIGWVCALPKEQTAATAMLDEIHPTIQKPSSDPNNYTLGSISKHNVVIACLPKGQIGTNSAATVATWMVSTFPCIKFGLMVGIGGGVPPEVRLGDVVVSTPTGQFPGVVQWDMGKARENGNFERTGSLNNPPTSLLTALSKLETEHELTGTKMPEYLKALRNNWPQLASKYLRSNSLKDVLFQADYSHVSGSTLDDEDEGDEEENCRFCDKTKVVKRRPRGARVHYGLIASGNQVIKDAIFRKKLNKDLGGRVLCIEMEAAGLMNNFPCVVIRGICDYADSHKNKDWQEHAAAMAAALAKELLQYVQPDDVDREPSIKDILNQVHNIVSKTGADVAQMISISEREEDLKILDWLTPRDYGLQQSKYIKMHQEGTGQWLLDSVKFMAWVKTAKQTLFCPGMPGTGKTILTAVVVDNLASQFSHDSSVGIAYIYFNFWQQEEQTVEDLFASLLKQLARGQSSLPASVKDLYNHHKRKGTQPSLDKISKVLQSVIGVYSRVFIVIDALDECQASDNCRVRFLKGLDDFQKCGASIFATSRFIPEVTDKFERSTWLEIRASDDDIRSYVDGQISQGGSVTLQDMQAEASTEIVRTANGLFLLAKLDLDSLFDAKLPRDIKTKLKNLPKGSKAYSQAYEEIMKRIEHQGPISVKLAKNILSWIIFAKRRLTMQELQHALAVGIGGSRLDQTDLPQVQDLISVCAGLVMVNEGSDIICLFHYTAQEYFMQTQRHWFPDAEDDITGICITYLSFDVFKGGFCPTDAEFEEQLRSYLLYDYAAHNWGHHAREAINLNPLVLDFLQYQAKVEASSQALFAVKESGRPHYSQNVPKQTTGLHLAAYFGIEKAVRILLNVYSLDLEDSYNRTPLSWAAENGHEAVVWLLLKKGANPNATDHSGLTPRSWATQGGHEALVRLFNTDINIESTNTEGQTLLQSAVRSLSNGGANIKPAKNSGQTPPSDENGRGTVVRLVIDKGVHAEAVGNEGQTPSPKVAANESEAVVRVLLYGKEPTNSELVNMSKQIQLLWANSNTTTERIAQLEETIRAIESKANGNTTTERIAQLEETIRAVESKANGNTTVERIAQLEETIRAIESKANGNTTTERIAQLEETIRAIESKANDTTTERIAQLEDSTRAIESKANSNITIERIAQQEERTGAIESLRAIKSKTNSNPTIKWIPQQEENIREIESRANGNTTIKRKAIPGEGIRVIESRASFQSLRNGSVVTSRYPLLPKR